MEKKTPHCKLSVVRALIKSDQVRSTKVAREGAAALGLDFDGMLAVITSLAAADFYKSMTTHADHRVWQDVYRLSTPVGRVYVKLAVVEDVLVVSFKELYP
jgi:motility quorum-sensing regulator/GCU-specific mRNA interferase toxin